MKKSRFTEQQIAYAFRLAEQGTPSVEVCRRLGVSEPTRVSMACRLKSASLVSGTNRFPRLLQQP